MRAGNVALLPAAEPARAAATVARAVDAVHAFYDYPRPAGVAAGRRLASFSRTPKPHWRSPGRTGGVVKRMVTVPVPKAAPKTLWAEEVQALVDACSAL